MSNNYNWATNEFLGIVDNYEHLDAERIYLQRHREVITAEEAQEIAEGLGIVLPHFTFTQEDWDQIDWDDVADFWSDEIDDPSYGFERDRWTKITAKLFDYLLNVVPPAAEKNGCWAVGDPSRACAYTGLNVYTVITNPDNETYYACEGTILDVLEDNLPDLP